jgi:PAS domain S-box-containing protein
MAVSLQDLGDAPRRAEIDELRFRLAEAEETLRAIRCGEADAIVIEGAAGPEVYTLESADRPYRIIVERMQEGALTLTPEGTVLYSNRALAALLRAPLDRIVGQRFQGFVAAADRESFARLLEDSGRGGGRGEIALSAADGTAIPVYLSTVDLPEEGQRVISGIVTDLTEQKERAEQLGETNARLAAALEEREHVEGKLRQAQKMEAVGRLTAGIAHDFNNLLTVIAGNLDLMQVRAADEVQKRQVETIQRALNRTVRLTDQLLAFSHQRTLRARPVSVNELLRETEPLLRRAVGDEVRVKLAFGRDAGRVLIDAAELQASMLNLAMNAKDAMPGGGTLTIATGMVAGQAIPETAAAALGEGPCVVIAVCDTGHGMPPEVRDRAFDPFFTTKDVGKGTGLGLSQVYGFVRQSGGHIAIESGAGAGTTVRLYLPRTEAEAVPERAAEPDAARGQRHGRRVLVVEDDDDVRRFVVELLEDAGYLALEAETGPAAMRILDRGAALDVVVTDVRMPDGMSGFDLAQTIRSRLPHVAIVLTSGLAAFDGSERTHGDWPVLRKPFRRDDILRAIEEGLKQHA